MPLSADLVKLVVVHAFCFDALAAAFVRYWLQLVSLNNGVFQRLLITKQCAETYRLADNVTSFTLRFNYGISVCVKSTHSLRAHILRQPCFINFFQYLLPTNCCDTIILRRTYRYQGHLINFASDTFANN